MVLDDTHIGMLRALGDDVLAEIVAVYLASTPANMKAMAAALAADDLVGLRHEAHSLKGASGNVGAVALSLACKHLEHAADTGAVAQLPGFWAAVQARYAEAREALEAL